MARHEFAEPRGVDQDQITSVNDAPERDPRSWCPEGSHDGLNWVRLDDRSSQSFANRFQANTYEFANVTAYRFHRLGAIDSSGDTGRK